MANPYLVYKAVKNWRLLLKIAIALFLLVIIFITCAAMIILTVLSEIIPDIGIDTGGYRIGAITRKAEQEIPPEYIDTFKSAGQKYGIPWTTLAACAKHDSKFGQQEGFINLREDIWSTYGQDGDYDEEINEEDSYYDAIFTLANYLKENNFKDDPTDALYATYNSWSYVKQILLTAEEYTDTLLPIIDGKWPLPANYTSISSIFGKRVHPVTGRRKAPHKGIDIPADQGTPIYPASEGKVIFTGVQSGYGNLIIISHQGNTTTIYAHLSQINVTKDQTVTRDDIIGLVGSTGLSTGPHLHFEVRIKGVPIDPEPWFTL